MFEALGGGKRRRQKQPFEGTGFFRALTIRGKRSLLFIPHGKESMEYKGILLEIVLHPSTSEKKVIELTDAFNQVVEAVSVSNLIQRTAVSVSIKQHS
jgi:hypothetical protein